MKTSFPVLCALFGLSMLAAAGPAQALPPWCANVHENSPDAEWAVCDNADLGNLDDVMNTAYKRARYDSSHLRREIRNTQKAWLRRRNRCGDQVGCLRSVYQQRIYELESYFAN
ncbi:MAG: lysozyme inhibitor LprI family protein [Pseudomonadota bacterium]